jgi:hypothetical protein
MQTNLDRHGLRPIPIICHLLDPPSISLPTTFKQQEEELKQMVSSSRFRATTRKGIIYNVETFSNRKRDYSTLFTQSLIQQHEKRNRIVTQKNAFLSAYIRYGSLWFPLTNKLFLTPQTSWASIIRNPAAFLIIMKQKK